METNNWFGEDEGKIYEENYGLIGNAIAILFTPSEIQHLGLDDLKQEGAIGLLKAIRTYDGSKGVVFSTYATICIRNEMRNYSMKNRFGGTKVGKRTQYNAIRKGREAAEDFVYKHSVSICGQSDFPDGFTDICGRKFYPSAEDEAVANLWLNEAVDSISSVTFRNVINTYLNCMNAKETATKLNISEATVSRALNALKEKMMESISE